MKKCTKCGANVEDGVNFCPICGASMEQTEAPKNEKSDLGSKIQDFNNTADSTSEFDADDIEKNKIMGVLAYLSWLVLIPLFAAPKSKFARFHANQGLVLAITEIAWAVLTRIIGAIGLSFLGVIMSLVNILFVVLAIIGIINALNGRAKDLPIVGKFRILK